MGTPGTDPVQPTVQVIEARARLYDAETYEYEGDLSKAFWLNDAAKAAVGMLFLDNREQPHVLLDGTITVEREGDFMVARLTRTPAPSFSAAPPPPPPPSLSKDTR